jgi:hypothetical protein
LLSSRARFCAMSAAVAPAPRGMQRRSLVLAAAAPLSPASSSALPAAAAHSPAAFARRRLSLGESALMAAAPRISSDSLATGSSSSSGSSAQTIMPHSAVAATPRGRQASLARSPRSDVTTFAAASSSGPQQQRHARRSSSIGIASDAPSWLPRGGAVDTTGRPAAAKADASRRYSSSNRTRPQSSTWDYVERPKAAAQLQSAAVLQTAAVLHSGRASQARRPGTADGVRRVGSSSSLLPLQLASPARSGPFNTNHASPPWTTSTPPASKQTSPSRRFSTSYFNSQAEMQRRSKESDTSRSDITSSFEDSQYSSGDLSTCSDDRSSATSASISAPSSPADDLDVSTTKSTRKERAPLAPFTARTWMRERDDDDGETFAPHREARQSYLISPSFGQRIRNDTLASFYGGDRRGASPFTAPRDVRVPMTVEGARIIARRASANSMRDAYDAASTSSRSIASRTHGSVTPQSAAAASAFQPAWQFQPPTSKRGSVGSIDSMRETAPVGSPSALFPEVPFRPFPVSGSRRASGSSRRRSQGTDTTAEDLQAASKRLHRGSMPQGFRPLSMAGDLPPRSGSSMSRRGSMSLEDALAKARAVRQMSGDDGQLEVTPASTDADLLRALADAPSPPPRPAFSPVSRSATPLARESVQKRRSSQPPRPASPAMDPPASGTAFSATIVTAKACTLNFARPFRAFEEASTDGSTRRFSIRSSTSPPATPTTPDFVVTRPKLQLAASSPAVVLSSSPSAISPRMAPLRMLSEPMLSSPPPSRSVSPLDTSRPLPSVTARGPGITASATQPVVLAPSPLSPIPLCSTFSRDSTRVEINGSQPISPEKVSRIRKALRRFFGGSAKAPVRDAPGAAETRREPQLQQSESGIGCIVLAAADDAAAEEYRDWLNKDVRARTGNKKPVNLAHVWKAEMARGGAAPPSALGLAEQPASAPPMWPAAEPVAATTSKRASKRSSTGSFMRLRAMSLATPSTKSRRDAAPAPPMPTSTQQQQQKEPKLPKSSSSASLADMARRHSKLRRSSLQSLSSYLRQRT